MLCFSDGNVLAAIASHSGNEIVYAVDENGNEIALALIVDGTFNQNNMEVMSENFAQSPMNWIGGEEECVSSMNEIESQVKQEIIEEDKTSIEKIDGGQNDSRKHVKTYKVKRQAQKNLKNLKKGNKVD